MSRQMYVITQIRYKQPIRRLYNRLYNQIIQPDYTTYTGDQNLEGRLYNRLYNQIIQPDYTTRLYNQIIQPDYTTYTSDQNLEALLQRLEHDSALAIEWFEANYMKLNEDKCHLLISGHKFESVWPMIGNTRIWESQQEKLLGVTIDKDLKFNKHISNICMKASRKLTALGR